jgi:hypothetical protein
VEGFDMRQLAGSVVAGFVLAGVLGGTTLAQDAASLSPDQLDQLVGPIALYPDPLLAEITAAATFPDQIVIADRDLGQGMSADDVAQQGLDPSVQALAHYPNLLKWLDDNLPWTTQLGQAFGAQQSEVMDAVQRMRAKAQSLGNLQTSPQETVANDSGDIEIEPADPDDIYVPEYNPDAIYYTPGVFCTFGIGLPVGIWWNHDWDWHHHQVIFWDNNHPRPHDWWTRPPSQRHNFPSAHVWHPAAGRVVFGGDRGYPKVATPPRPVVHAAPFRPGTTRVAPPVRAITPPVRAVPAPREPAPLVEHVTPERAPVPARSGEGGIFGGAESSRSTESFSSRGAESRGVNTPVNQGFHGGGASRGGQQKR